MTENASIPAAWHQQPDGLYRYWDGQQWLGEPVPAPPAGAPMVVAQAPVVVAPLARSIVSDKESKPVQASLAWIIAACTLGYMIPWAVAATRGKDNAGAIGWVNLLAGWTVIGWIIALVMACGSHNKFLVQG